MDYFKYLSTRLSKAFKDLEELDDTQLDPSILLATINGVRNVLFEVLDYMINQFPGYEGDSRELFFPILKINESLMDLDENPRAVTIKKVIGQKGINFVKAAYKIIFNDKYDNCMLLLNSSIKHRNEDLILGEKPSIEAKIISFGGPTLEEDIYGGIRIGGFTSMPGAVTDMSNCSMTDNSGKFTFIKKLETKIIPGNSLLLSKDGKQIRVLIRPFLKKCLSCCSDIVSLWKTYL
jgi:hypothetical protein